MDHPQNEPQAKGTSPGVLLPHLGFKLSGLGVRGMGMAAQTWPKRLTVRAHPTHLD
jgi:hypothetical protein